MNRSRASFAILAFVLSVSGLARAATTYYYSGQQCQWYDGSVAGLQYTSSGAVNNMTSGSRGLLCPANGYVNSNLVTIQSAAVVFYDGNASLPVQCTWFGTNWDGSVYWSPTVFSCSTWGGCSYNADPGYVGQNQVNFTNPFPSIYANNVSAQCIVPSSSKILGYNMTLP